MAVNHQILQTSVELFYLFLVPATQFISLPKLVERKENLAQFLMGS